MKRMECFDVGCRRLVSPLFGTSTISGVCPRREVPTVSGVERRRVALHLSTREKPRGEGTHFRSVVTETFQRTTFFEGGSVLGQVRGGFL